MWPNSRSHTTQCAGVQLAEATLSSEPRKAIVSGSLGPRGCCERLRTGFVGLLINIACFTHFWTTDIPLSINLSISQHFQPVFPSGISISPISRLPPCFIVRWLSPLATRGRVREILCDYVHSRDACLWSGQLSKLFCTGSTPRKVHVRVSKYARASPVETYVQ